MITKKPFLTRKNLIIVSLAVFYSLLFCFVGVCIEASHTIIPSKNIIAKLATGFGFAAIDVHNAGFIALGLCGIYISVYVIAVLCIRRYLIENKKKTYNLKAFALYGVLLLICLLLSIGVGILFTSPIDGKSVSNLITFIAQTLCLTTIIYAVIFVLVGATAMLIINFIFVDKPFRWNSKEEMNILDEKENENLDVSESFDPQESVSASFGTPIASTVGVGHTESSVSSVKRVEELDAKEKVFPALSTVDYQYSGYDMSSIPSDDIKLDALCERFRNYLAKEEQLYFDIDTIRVFISAFASSHFMILEGLSGTGKSSLPRYFAKFTNSNLLFVPVQATWRDKTNLLGYFNDFSKTYNETDFLTHIYKANYDSDRIHMFVLDEMNISRVEYYFADLLSVLEYPVPDWKIRLMQIPYDFTPPHKLEGGVLQITENCYFVGTANKDDSTFSIADKVYDRAITIDFDYRNKPFNVVGESEKINLSASHLRGLYDEAINNKDFQMTEEDFAKFERVTDFVYENLEITFGNRIMNQIETIVPAYIACGGEKEEILDFLFARKIIAKVEGRFEEYVKGNLKQLLQLLAKTYGQGVFKRSERVINTLIRRL